MAERRMFAKSVINSGRFLMMPPSSRLLYYDLGMAADDDGVVEALSVLRTTGATEDDLRVLCSKQYITILNDDLVSYINDWKRNNLIRPDRYHPSTYKELLVKINSSSQNESGLPTVNQWLTQYSIGKDSIGKYRLDKDTTQQTTEYNSIPIACTREEIPKDQELLKYFSVSVGEESAGTEAFRFKQYNESRNWDCLPDWKTAADRWINNIN